MGNVRLSYSDANGDGVVNVNEIIEESNYYPFGLKHKGYNNVVNGTHYPYGFNGKEENEELGLRWIDFGARNYDATLGRWMNLDPLAEQMYSYSTYNYGFDNPIYFFDVDGNIPLPQIIKYLRIGSLFGIRTHPITGNRTGHFGVDLPAPEGSPVRSAARGKVVKIGWNSKKVNGKIVGYGRYIVIEHAKGYYSLYSHLEKNGTMVNVGDNISNGQLIATSGNTGGSTGPHLHFEIIKANSLSGVFNNDDKINPLSINDLDVLLHGDMSPLFTINGNFETDFSNLNAILSNGISLFKEELGTSLRKFEQLIPSRQPVSPLTITPKPITPLPVTPPSPGPIVIPPPTPAPNPIIIPPRPPDSGI